MHVHAPRRWEPTATGIEAGRWHIWLARRRIALSLTGFTSLVFLNMFGRETVPHNPSAWTDPVVAFALLLLLGGLAIRSWSAGTLNKSRELTMVGPYALIRNPLYVGSFLMMIAFGILCRDWLVLLFVLGPMSLLYRFQIGYEEQWLSQLFPGQWNTYQRCTPRFVPNGLPSAVWTGWSLSEWKRNREYRAVLAVALGLVLILAWRAVRVSA